MELWKGLPEEGHDMRVYLRDYRMVDIEHLGKAHHWQVILDISVRPLNTFEELITEYSRRSTVKHIYSSLLVYLPVHKDESCRWRPWPSDLLVRRVLASHKKHRPHSKSADGGDKRGS